MATLTEVSAELAPRWALARSTLARDLVADPKRRFEVEIGDAKQNDFYPQVKLKGWDNETNLSVRLVDGDPLAGAVTTTGADIEWSRAGRAARLYELAAAAQFEDGGIEFEVELAAAPAGNELAFTITTKGLVFAKQPATLADFAAAVGTDPADVIVPDNVLDSYAVYHATRRGNYSDRHYRTGKAFHVFRPHAVDAVGNETWCDIDIDPTPDPVSRLGRLTVTVPQAFLDAATYPVRVDPTFGKTDIGASSSSISTGDLHSSAAAPGSDGTIDSIFLYSAGNGGTRSATCGTYESAGSDNPSNFQGATAERSDVTTTPAWREFTYASGPSCANGVDQFAAYMADGDMYQYYDVVSPSSNAFDFSPSYATFPDPWTSESGSNARRSVYFSYTASGGGSYDQASSQGAPSLGHAGVGTAAFAAAASGGAPALASDMAGIASFGGSLAGGAASLGFALTDTLVPGAGGSYDQATSHGAPALAFALAGALTPFAWTKADDPDGTWTAAAEPGGAWSDATPKTTTWTDEQ